MDIAMIRRAGKKAQESLKKQPCAPSVEQFTEVAKLRERCAKIADEMARNAEENMEGSGEPQFSFEDGEVAAARTIAKSIRALK